MKRDIPTFLLYALGFLLLWEWLRPIEQLTTTDHIETFVIFLVFLFAASFFKLRQIWKFILNLGFILSAINRFHYDGEFFKFLWMTAFSRDLLDNLSLIWVRNWAELTNEFRTLLFFILLWLMVYLIHYWLLNRHRIFIFFFLTIIYITVLDTFTAYNATAAIVRTTVAGFAVIGMLTYYRILSKEKVDHDHSITRKWMRPLALMIAISVLIGIAAPKASPIWPDPVPYIKTAADKGGVDGNRGGARVGYGTNDSRLGGPFIGDDSIVFQAEASEKNYWKVETKDSYTGKGWVSSGSTPLQFRNQDLVPVFSIPESVETEEETAKLHLFIDYNHLIYPAGIQRFKFNQNYNLEIDTNKEKITVLDFNQVDVAPDSYSVEYAVPKYNASELRITADSSQTSPEFIKKYTQLPENLPVRVKQLAEEITAGKSNWFDKAKAVESYFGSSEYTYDQTNVAIPGEDDDYVDQFLFDSKIGYCDNFSTSMAVMLRTLGIPTRWVKGYTGGEFIGYSKLNPSEQIYEITNNNAHSWVEVYFPNQGWVPFEPTKGFFNDISINYLTDGETPSSLEAAPPPVPRPVQEKPEESINTSGADDSANLQDLWLNIKNFLVKNWRKMVFSIIAVGGIVGILYRIRGKWVPYLYLLRFKLKKNEDNIGEAYLILLNQLDRYGLKRKENQTLRNYASYIDNFFSTKEMTRLTDRYEQFLYHQQLPEGSWKDSRKLWENLIKKTIA